MRIGFFIEQKGQQSDIYFDLANKMIASARKVMPDVLIYQLTDGKSPEVYGVDSVYRELGNMPMAVRRMKLHAQEGDWLFVDPDVIFQKDVRHVFDEPFDVALTDRIGTEMEGTKYAKAMPYNMGVTFSRCPDFWDMARLNLMLQHPKLQEWEGDQMVVCKLADFPEYFPYAIKILPGRIYNYPPSGNEDLSHAAILHFKGVARKRLMEAA